MAQAPHDRVALIVGVTGIVGLGLARKIMESQHQPSWSRVYGLSRRKQDFIPVGITHVQCDLACEVSCAEAFTRLNDVTHVFYATWTKGSTEDENIQLNCCMMGNLLQHLPPGVRHFALVTGTKHYMGPHSAFGVMGTMVTPWREVHPRLPIQNFYYNLEDLVYAAAEKRGFTWTVSRPHIIIGFAPENQMNMATSVAVYASICKYLNLPFTFPGCREAYTIVLDAVDVAVLGDHLLWQVNTPSAANRAFNVVNGDQFRWRELWKDIAGYFELEVGPDPDKPMALAQEMSQHSQAWDEIVRKFGLKSYRLEEIATWWLLTVSMSRTQDCFADMSRSRELGFHTYQNTTQAFFRLFDELKKGKYIP